MSWKTLNTFLSHSSCLCTVVRWKVQQGKQQRSSSSAETCLNLSSCTRSNTFKGKLISLLKNHYILQTIRRFEAVKGRSGGELKNNNKNEEYNPKDGWRLSFLIFVFNWCTDPTIQTFGVRYVLALQLKVANKLPSCTRKKTFTRKLISLQTV